MKTGGRWCVGGVLLGCEMHMVHVHSAPAQPGAPLLARDVMLQAAPFELDDGRDRRKPAGRAEAGPMPRSHGNSLDSNLDTFVLLHPGQSGRRGQGGTLHRSQIGPPPVEAKTFT